MIMPSLPLGHVSTDSNFDAPLAGGQWDTFHVSDAATLKPQTTLFSSGKTHGSEVAKAQTLESQKKHEQPQGIVQLGAFHTSWCQSVPLIMPPTPTPREVSVPQLS